MSTKPKQPAMNDDERAQMLEGLAEIRRRIRSNEPVAEAHIGNTLRQQLRLSPRDLRDLSIMRGYLSLCCGRVVPLTLVTRLALDLLAKECANAASGDEVVKARLRADANALRMKRATLTNDPKSPTVH